MPRTIQTKTDQEIRLDGWKDGRMNESMGGWINGRVNGLING